MGDFFKPCPSRAKAGFKKSPVPYAKDYKGILSVIFWAMFIFETFA
jgi:hypothetical protein